MACTEGYRGRDRVTIDRERWLFKNAPERLASTTRMRAFYCFDQIWGLFDKYTVIEKQIDYCYYITFILNSKEFN